MVPKTQTDPLLRPNLHVVLDRPRIAANIAAIVRLCAGTNCALHVCGPLLFASDDKTKWRAGLDYFHGARVHFHDNVQRCLALLNRKPWLVEVGSQRNLWEADFESGDVVVLGPEDGSIDDNLMHQFAERIVTLPQTGPVRSLNLSQCAAVTVFEALRQQQGK